MEANNNEVASLLKSLTERFDSLQKDVEALKNKDARRSASEPEAESSQDDGAASVAQGPSHERERTQDERRPKRRRRSRRTRSDSSDTSRSRSRSRSARRRKGKSPARRSGGRSPRDSRSWADRMSDSEEERMDYAGSVHFSDSEAGDQPSTKLVEVSERTRKFLQEKCTRRVTNSERKLLRDPYPLPKVPATRTPQLDAIMKPEASPTTKAVDKQLAKVQTLMLDTLAPLTSVVESHNRGNTLEQKEVLQAVKVAISLVGNANATMSHLRRERVVCDLNKSLLPIVGDDSNFQEAAPLLFGTEFSKKGKEMVDQVKALRSTISKKQERKPPFFRGGPPSNRGGFSRNYGRGGAQNFRYRERPYHRGKGQTQGQGQKRT